MRLLMVEDDKRLSHLVSQGLEDAGFIVDAVETAQDGIAAIETTQFDAIVLDRSLPDGDGVDVLKRLRAQDNATPIIILTARDGLKDRVDGLNSGADDYLLKPFEMEELVARVKALLRRPGGALGVVLKAGNILFDTVERIPKIEGKDLTLTKRELGLLELLMRRMGKVTSRDVIEENIYGFNENISSNSVEVAVHRLRRRLKKSDATVTVHTVRGVGYILDEEE